ncbi:MAG: hypothetical protein HC788_10785 [Sphingopyxis sp.]|nr:hypothetical protein [Sphingopyxis sp.]
MADAGQLRTLGGTSIIGRNAIDISHVNRTTGIDSISSGGALNLSSFFSIRSDASSRIAAQGDINIGTDPFGIVDLAEVVTQSGRLTILTGTLDLARGSAGENIVITATDVAIADRIDAGADIRIAAGTGPLAIGIARAGDDIVLTGGTMALTDMRATGTGPDSDGNGADFTITSTANVSIDHAEAASDFRATVAGDFTTGLNSIITGGDIVIAAGDVVNLGNSAAGGLITVTGAQIDFAAVQGAGDVRLTTVAGTPSAAGPPQGNGNITGGTLASGGNAVVISNPAGGNITLTSLQATGHSGLYASSTTGAIIVGPAAVGQFLEARGASLNFGNVVAGTDVALSSFNGALAVGDVTAGDDIFLTVHGSNANPNLVTPDPQTGTVSSTQFALTAGNLRSTGAGSDAAASAPGSFGNAGPAGNVIRIRASGAVNTGDVTTAGHAIFVSDLAGITTRDVTGTAGVGVFARGNVAMGNVTTNGALWVGDSSQNFLITPAYTVSNFGFSQTPTSGSAAFGNVVAGIIRGTTPGGLTYGTLRAANDILWSTFTGSAVGGGATGGTITAGGSITFTIGGDVAVGAVSGGPSVNIQSAQGRLSAPSVTAGTIGLSGAAGLDIPIVESPGQVTIGSANGDVRVATNIIAGGNVVASGRSVFLRSNGPLNLQNIITNGGNIDVVAAGNLTVQNANAGADLLLSSGGTAVIDGTGTGVNVRVTSADIAIGANGRLGTFGTTQSLRLSGGGTNSVTFIGGTGPRTGYHLDAAEMTRLFGNGINVTGQLAAPAGTPNRAPDVVVDDFSINAGTQLGANGTFRIDTPGKLRVLGDARFTGMVETQSVQLSGANAVEVILGSGSVHLTGSAPDQLAGTLTLQSDDDIVVATTQAITDIAALTDLAAINARLAQNDGVTDDIGALAANRINLNHDSGSSVYIQNSGAGATFDQRRGISFGAGGLVVTGPGPSDRLVINAVQRTATGVVTGLATIPLININAPANSAAVVQTGFNPLSTVNGCALGNIPGCSRPPTRDPNPIFRSGM